MSKIRFVSGFLIPNLDSEKFGDHLKWIDKSKKMFQIVWSHKGGPSWTEEEAEVFVEWDKHKGHFHPETKNYFTESKQRFRALLYKLTQVGQLENVKCEDKRKRVYCIIKMQHKRRRRRSGLDAEKEFSNKDDDEDDNVNSEDIYKRRISEDDALNVLEDHAYSSTNTFQGLEQNSEAQVLLNSIPYDSTGHLEKRILVEKNSMEYLNSQYINANNDFQDLEVLFKDEFLNVPYNENTLKLSEKSQDNSYLTLSNYCTTVVEENPFFVYHWIPNVCQPEYNEV